ncbi:Transcription factor [Komagataella phaffii CBS 7435]|uniref:Proposed transcriptional activator, member of the Gal4p family of zinc cluster proteins n=2 Tax=Komagataella phaffii TaxID=460519 RepID=C4R754_KOMPG|nr:uncharacterized protein PAS_chr4_0203 [Komagataella phaffii GS115]AOA65001.1 GQ67_04520T0 [Komagataella phaffii]CAH2451200.1 Transcription factor [Komagataella phaffii CBS 7435]AOA69745.1 GQ68_04492T0 [Komagataella phaffii GS115]CAY71429.1 Proposed transcriptional activator, member of the Gal4p family of zinc cluster proteins [Komagataella phaffii GS115]CCA40959.1 Transcription factor [Komagataella phaffii CBS 7435]
MPPKHRLEQSIQPMASQQIVPGNKVILPNPKVDAKSTPNISVQKRRRVTRACDECRKKKVKCDGQQPCIHCTVYSYECTYSQPSSKKRQGQSLSLSAPSNINATSSVQKSVKPPEIDFQRMRDALKYYEDLLNQLIYPNSAPTVRVNPIRLASILKQLRADKSSDELISVKALSDNYIEMLHKTMQQPVQQPAPPSLGQGGSFSNHSPNHNNASIDGSIESNLGREIRIILPPRDIALKLIYKTWDNACVLFRFYHRPAFIEDLNELYETDLANYTNKQQRFLPLVYSVMACGALFCKTDGINHGQKSSKPKDSSDESLIDDEGYKYFIAARKLIDITDTRDTYGIQTIVMLIIFLQCSARLSTCYSYIGIALRAALREGLHRQLNYPFNPIELETRKRLFWTIYKMDIYVNTMLGLPRTISEEDFDQEMPIELDDENISETGYRFDLQGTKLSSSGIANAHTRLIFIMKKIVKKLYPVKLQKPTSNSGDTPLENNDLLAHEIVHELEMDLQNWVNSLPAELKPGIEPPTEYFKANRLLHLAYLHVKIILYRPFIHYISEKDKVGNSSIPPSPEEITSIEKAKNCVNVARIVVKLAEDMINRKMLSGSYWFSIYTIFFSVACLVYYVHFAPPKKDNGELDPQYMEIKKDTESGREVLNILKDSSMAARRTYNILNSLFEQLNRRTAKVNLAKAQQPPSGLNNPAATQYQKQGEHRQLQPSNYSGTVKSVDPENIDYSSFGSQFENTNIEDGSSNTKIDQKVNGVNYIDGVFTGINLNMPNLSETSNTQGIDNPAFQSINNSNLNNNFVQTKYIPGMMDQLDMKIFGRFLPPYMLNSNKVEQGQNERNLSGQPSSSNTPDGSQPVTVLDGLYPLQNDNNNNHDPGNSKSVVNNSNSVENLLQNFTMVPSGLSSTVQNPEAAQKFNNHMSNISNMNDPRRASVATSDGSNDMDHHSQGPINKDLKPLSNYEFDDLFFNDWTTAPDTINFDS